MKALTNKLNLSKVHRIGQAAVPAGLNRRAQPGRPRGIGRHAALNLTLTAALLLGAACGDSLVLSEEDQRHRPGAADAGGHIGGDPEERGDGPAPPPETPPETPPEPGPNGLTEADPAAIDVHPEPDPGGVAEGEPAAIYVPSPQPDAGQPSADALSRALTEANCPGVGTVNLDCLRWSGGDVDDLELSGAITFEAAYLERYIWQEHPEGWACAPCSVAKSEDATCIARIEAACQRLCGTEESCEAIGGSYRRRPYFRSAWFPGSKARSQPKLCRICAAGAWHHATDEDSGLDGSVEAIAPPLKLRCVAATDPSNAPAWQCQDAAAEAPAKPHNPAVIAAYACLARQLEGCLDRASERGSQ